MSWIRTGVRFVLAFVGLFVLLQPFWVVLAPPDPTTYLLASGVVAVAAVLSAVVFVRRGHSVRRLCVFFVGLSVAGAGLSVVLRVASSVAPVPATISATGVIVAPENPVLQLGFLVVLYAIDYYFVYFDGYGRLKARFA